jgi:hypothetical protein
MRRTVLSSITVMSLTALSIVACATAPVDDDFSGLTQEQNPTQPEEPPPSAKLPPSSQSTDPAADAGTDAKAPPKDAGAPPKDASTPPPDSSTPPPPPPGGDCDPNDPTYFLKFAMESNPTLCPCSASQCCYMGLGCVTK